MPSLWDGIRDRTFQKQMSRPARDLVVLKLIEEHGKDFASALGHKYKSTTAQKPYFEALAELRVEGMVKRAEDDTEPWHHLTAAGRQHLHALRSHQHLSRQLFWAIVALAVGALLQGARLWLAWGRCDC